MGYIHPFFMAISVPGGLYVLWLGWSRFCSLHLNLRLPFAWKRHVRLGGLALATWTAGSLAGLFMARDLWGDFMLTGPHAYVGLAIIPLCVFGYLSGRIMDKTKKRRKWLPLAHGACNLLLILLGLFQLQTGWHLLDML